MEKCLTPDCNKSQARALKTGQCMTCYSAAKKLVDAKRTTWAQLAEMGLALGPQAVDKFAAAFEAKTKEVK